ncbi:sulfotransferase [Salinimonas marina]|uniref:Sulfotransferase n=1 Tax=Salinimonas marina TaxID=2785918 RepID=A0A7S9HE88_9ALTE|nr:sulfotransferase [Salinimonas marina]QPG06406.1 sulfotransferase [Salinimonas marina]
MSQFKSWFSKTHSVPLFQKEQSRKHIQVPIWKLAIKGKSHSILRPKAFKRVNSFVQFLSFPRSGHSLIGSLLDAHPNAIVSHELDAMGLIHKGLSKNIIYGLIENNSNAFTRHGRFWNGFSYEVKNQLHGDSDCLTVIGDKKGDWAVRWFDKDPQLITKLRQTTDDKIRWILVTRNPLDNIATLSLRKNRTYDEVRIQHKSGDTFAAELKNKQESGTIAASVRDDMIADYRLLCNTISNMQHQLADEEVLHVIYEDFCADPDKGLSRLCDFLNIEPSADYLRNCSAKITKSLHKSRQRVEWSQTQVDEVRDIAQNHEFLNCYLNDMDIK